MTTANTRTADHPIDAMFLKRWSPRAFTAEPIGDGDLFTLFEAARWAPSSYNSQPWRFLYARRDTEHWPLFLGLLNAFNQSWARHAAALVIILSKTTLLPTGSDKEVFSRTHSFDAGAAWGYLALEAARLGWAAHGMAGFDVERSAVELGIPASYRVEAAVAIGRPGPKSMLPDALAAREQPSGRLPLSALAREGRFDWPK